MVKVNKKVMSIGLLATLSLTLGGCQTEKNTIQTNEFSISSEQIYNDVVQASPVTVLEATLKASDVKLLDKVYGSENIDESKLLTKKKAASGPTYLTDIATASGLIVTNDDEAKKALRYMEQQKMAVKEFSNKLITEEDAKQHKQPVQQLKYSVKHVLLGTEEEAKKMKELISSGAESFESLKAKSDAEQKSSGKKEFTVNNMLVKEVADYPDTAQGVMDATFETAALTTSPLNGWSDPVNTKFGSHLQFVYARTEKTASGVTVDIEKAREEISTALIASKGSESALIKSAMIMLRENNKFTLTDETLKTTYETYKSDVAKAFAEEKKTAESSSTEGVASPTSV